MIRNFFKPNPNSNPLLKNVGYGWGWLVLIISSVRLIDLIDAWKGLSTAGYRVSLFIAIPFILLIYFRLRKIFIDRRYSKNIWMNSFIAGAVTSLVSGLLIMLASSFFQPAGYQEAKDTAAHYGRAMDFYNKAAEIIKGQAPDKVGKDALKGKMEQWAEFLKKALDEAREADVKLLNREYKEFGDHFQAEFIKGIELALEGYHAEDAEKLMAGVDLIEKFSEWHQDAVRQTDKK